MRRKVHPSRPNASICCLFSSLKTLLIPPEAINLLVGVNVPDDYLVAGFEVIMNGRFWAFVIAMAVLIAWGVSGAAVPLFKHLATGDKHGHGHCHLSDGVSDSTNAEQGCAVDTSEAQ